MLTGRNRPSIYLQDLRKREYDQSGVEKRERKKWGIGRDIFFFVLCVHKTVKKVTPVTRLKLSVSIIAL